MFVYSDPSDNHRQSGGSVQLWPKPDDDIHPRVRVYCGLPGQCLRSLLTPGRPADRQLTNNRHEQADSSTGKLQERQHRTAVGVNRDVDFGRKCRPDFHLDPRNWGLTHHRHLCVFERRQWDPRRTDGLLLEQTSRGRFEKERLMREREDKVSKNYFLNTIHI